VNRFAIALTLAVLSVSALPAQDPSPAAPKTAVVNDKFSGTVTELTSDSVTVVRTAPAKMAVTRKFNLDAQTKVEGKLKPKSRVTVQYESGEEGQYRAIHIIVR